MRSGAAPAPTTACPSPGRWWSICTTTQGCGPARCLPPIFTSSPGWPRPCRACATTTWRSPRRGDRWSFCTRSCPAGPTSPMASTWRNWRGCRGRGSIGARKNWPGWEGGGARGRVMNGAKEILARLEAEGARGEASAPRPSQLPLFAETSPLLRELELLDLNGLSPLEALNLLYEWQQRLFPSLRPPPDRHTPA